MGSEWLSGRPERLTGSIRASNPKEWVDAALESREAFEGGLRMMGMPSAEIDRAISLRDETEIQLRDIDEEIASYFPLGASFILDPVPLELRMRRASVWQHLADWVRDREVRVLEVASKEVRIPLFTLSCADVDGCTAAFNREDLQGRALEWNMTIYGSGITRSREVIVSASAEFTSEAGQTKIIFLPATVTVQKVMILQSGREIGSGVQIDSSSVCTDSSAPGLLLMPPGGRPPAGPPVTRFPLAGDTTGAIALYTWKYERRSKLDLDIGLEAFNSKISLRIGTELATNVTLKYGLRGGHDYVLHGVAQGDGLMWAPARVQAGGSVALNHIDSTRGGNT